jgi:hypothetical protein
MWPSWLRCRLLQMFVCVCLVLVSYRRRHAICGLVSRAVSSRAAEQLAVWVWGLL